MLQFDVTHALPFLPENWLSSRLDGLTEARNLLERGNGLGGAFTGWVDLPASYDPEELQRILQTARIIRGAVGGSHCHWHRRLLSGRPGHAGATDLPQL